MDNMTLHFLGAYTFNDENDDNIDYGDSYLLSAGIERPCLLSDAVITNAKLTYFYNDENSVNGVDWNDDVKNVDLWLQWNIKEKVLGASLGFGLKLPVVNEINGDNADKTTLFYISASNLF